jgi:hypothetical protein
MTWAAAKFCLGGSARACLRMTQKWPLVRFGRFPHPSRPDLRITNP